MYMDIMNIKHSIIYHNIYIYIYVYIYKYLKNNKPPLLYDITTYNGSSSGSSSGAWDAAAATGAAAAVC